MSTNHKYNRTRRPFLVAMLIVTFLLLIGATYAWFTYNRVVDTNRVSATTSEDNLKLLVSTEGGKAFKGKDVASISQVNSQDALELMPVSTLDLKSFLYSPATEGEKANRFTKVENEEFYYHGRIYIKAEGSQEYNGRKMSLYLDNSQTAGGDFVTARDPKILNATRLGMTFDGGNSVIFHVSDQSSPKKDQISNTYIDGVLMKDGNVLTLSKGKVVSKPEAAINFEDCTISMDDGAAKLPKRELYEIDVNKIYAVDIYFYLEGCDPDCSNKVMFDELDMHLAFYGILK